MVETEHSLDLNDVREISSQKIKLEKRRPENLNIGGIDERYDETIEQT
jgi:hypothetical protein